MAGSGPALQALGAEVGMEGGGAVSAEQRRLGLNRPGLLPLSPY